MAVASLMFGIALDEGFVVAADDLVERGNPGVTGGCGAEVDIADGPARDGDNQSVVLGADVDERPDDGVGPILLGCLVQGYLLPSVEVMTAPTRGSMLRAEDSV